MRFCYWRGLCAVTVIFCAIALVGAAPLWSEQQYRPSQLEWIDVVVRQIADRYQGDVPDLMDVQTSAIVSNDKIEIEVSYGIPNEKRFAESLGREIVRAVNEHANTYEWELDSDKVLYKVRARDANDTER